MGQRRSLTITKQVLRVDLLLAVKHVRLGRRRSLGAADHGLAVVGRVLLTHRHTAFCVAGILAHNSPLTSHFSAGRAKALRDTAGRPHNLHSPLGRHLVSHFPFTVDGVNKLGDGPVNHGAARIIHTPTIGLLHRATGSATGIALDHLLAGRSRIPLVRGEAELRNIFERLAHVKSLSLGCSRSADQALRLALQGGSSHD